MRPYVSFADHASAESTRWYGCESVLHHGGLCERTITQHDSPGSLAFYEELDMASTDRTKDLPFVRGDLAKFRYYAGVPLNPNDGPNIGTVFMFCENPSDTSRTDDIRSYLTETAKHITRHLEQAVEALEGQRALRFNRGITSLLELSHSVEVGNRSRSSSQTVQHGRPPLLSDRYSDDVLRLYHLAAKLLCNIFELDGARIQEAGSPEVGTISNPNWNGSTTMAYYLQAGTRPLGDFPASLPSKLLQSFPQGAVYQIDTESGAVIAATGSTPAASVDDSMSRELTKAFSGAEQIVLMPLWDTHHERNIGAILGFANDRSRAYLGSSDLSSISAFCATVMTQVRRLDVQAMNQIKSDFLGSISHEMRTPLHGILSNLELLAENPHGKDRRELLEMARFSGASLLDSMDRLLTFSKISSRAQRAHELSSQELTGLLSRQPSPAPHHHTTSPTKDDYPSIVRTCEMLVERAAQRLRLKRSVRPELLNSDRKGRNQHSLAKPTPILPYDVSSHPLVVFDTNVTHSCRLKAVTDFTTVFANLLVRYGHFEAPVFNTDSILGQRPEVWRPRRVYPHSSPDRR
jgi:signal transduction histidine kinase